MLARGKSGRAGGASNDNGNQSPAGAVRLNSILPVCAGPRWSCTVFAHELSPRQVLSPKMAYTHLP